MQLNSKTKHIADKVQKVRTETIKEKKPPQGTKNIAQIIHQSGDGSRFVEEVALSFFNLTIVVNMPVAGHTCDYSNPLVDVPFTILVSEECYNAFYSSLLACKFLIFSENDPLSPLSLK